MKLLNPLRKLLFPAKPAAQQIAARSLEEYQRQLLKHQDEAAYHTKMVEMCLDGIHRLASFKPTTMEHSDG